jgi:hypothetical protein
VTQPAISLIKNRLQDTYGSRMKFESGGARASRPSRSASSPNAPPVSSGETPEDATGTVALLETSVVRIIREPITPNGAASAAAIEETFEKAPEPKKKHGEQREMKL